MQVISEERSRPIKAWVASKDAVVQGRVGGVPFTYVQAVPDIEDSALAQLKNLARLPFIAPNGVAVMPDVHMGKGASVGTVIATDKAIIPSAVGVDIGCVDAETEYLSPTGWKRIADYDGGKVMQYWAQTGESDFVQPDRFIRLPADKFYHLKTKYGVDQMLSPEHRVLYRQTSRVKDVGELATTYADYLFEQHSKNKAGFSGKFITTFEPLLDSGVSLNDYKLRVMVMACADGSFDSRKTIESRRCVLQFTKTRKLERAEKLLVDSGLAFRRDDRTDQRGLVYRIIFDAPMREKSLAAFWAASKPQLEVIVSELMHWDGWDNKVYYTRDKPSADFVQYALSACGYRATMRSDSRGKVVDYRVFANTNVLVGMKGTPKSEITVVDGSGAEKFCFSVPSSFWVMRRGGNVVVTGNCGMNAVRLSLKASDLPDSLLAIRHQIERDVPLGAGGAHKEVADKFQGLYNTAPQKVIDAVSGSHAKFLAKAGVQLGTLGSGNHFIELCIDENQDVWVMLHSGSRGIGNMIGNYFIEKAKKRMEQYFITLPDGDLAYLPEDTDDFNDYVEAVGWAQNYAFENRRVMMQSVLAALARTIPVEFTVTTEAINCHHNYVEKENHFGRNLWVTRKGAIRAREGDLGIIPGSMGQRSYIVRGKGNPESYCSCSHGAGRAMSRAEAKRRFTLADLEAQTSGVECRKDADVLDEIPGSYKPLDLVMANQKDLVEVVHTLQAVLCVKGN
jgi:tRNA-splicing ligase RtcB